MISFVVHDTKEFMNLLLKQNRFDDFCIRNIDIVTFALFQMDGTKNKEYYSLAEQELIQENYCYWKELKPYVFQIIKGQKLPKYIKIVFSVPAQKQKEICTVPANYFLNVLFEKNTVICTTGCSLKTFTMDKSAEFVWDKWVETFFHQIHIAITIQS